MAQALTAEMIQTLLSSAKSRGDYDQVLSDFINSGEAGIEVDLQSGPLTGKRAKQVKVGFDNARKKPNKEGTGLVHPGGKNVKVIAITGKMQNAEGKEVDREDNNEDHVYLINLALATGAPAEAPSEEAA